MTTNHTEPPLSADGETHCPDTTPTAATAWVDLASPSHPFFFRSLVDELPELEATTTVRSKTETVDLTAEAGFDYTVLGRDFDNTLLRKAGIPYRTMQLARNTPEANISLSARNAMCILASKARGLPSIHFTDNDITAHVDGLRYEKLYNALEAQATYNVVPEAFETSELTRWGADRDSIVTYNGYKEDLSVANFEPDETFTDRLPFEEFVVVRPEALDAAYVDAEKSLVPHLLTLLVERGYNVVYLPRGRGDEAHADPYPNDRVYTPPTALNGLQLAWHCRCLLTGSGTMAREAACMGTPAVSFFPSTLLSVDRELVDEGRIFHSRDPMAIADYIDSLTPTDAAPSRERSRTVRDELVTTVSRLVEAETYGAH